MSDDNQPSNEQEPNSTHLPDGEQNVGEGTPDHTDTAQTPASAPVEAKSEPASPAKSAGGPISLERIRELRKSQQQAAPKTAQPVQEAAAEEQQPNDRSTGKKKSRDRSRKPAETGVIRTPEPQGVAPKIEVPSRRQPLSDDLEAELSQALGGSDLDSMLVGDSMLQVGHALTEGQRAQGKVVKSQDEFVFITLGGPNEGILPAAQFEEPPAPGTELEVVVRGFLAEEGLYELTIPGNAIEVDDWSDLNEGEVVEALVTGSNTGGLECKVGAIRGFIPASQAAEYRIENLGELVDQKFLCVITEANPRRGNLVLSRRAVLEREKSEKREQRLAAISVGDAVDGTVTKILDFGAFVDIGGLDGLLHISQLSWERVNHPSEILEVGQKVQVRIDKIDEQSGKIGLSYRSLQDHPWNDIDTRFPVGSIAKGTVTRIAEFGAFVKVATGVEGLVHISELAHHRVHRVTNVVNEGDEVEVKVLSIDGESQRMSLSIKGAQAAPATENKSEEAQETPDEPPPKPVLPKHKGPLKGGTGKSSGGEQFGLKW